MEGEINREVVAEAIARYLAAGGAITCLPDTVELQRAHLNFLMRLEGVEELDEL